MNVSIEDTVLGSGWLRDSKRKEMKSLRNRRRCIKYYLDAMGGKISWENRKTWISTLKDGMN